MEVPLTWPEIGLAVHEATNRAINAKSKGIRPKHGASTAFFDGLRIDVLGCLGELAVAKGLNRSWSGQHEIHSPDAANCIEVKTVDQDSKNLFVLIDDRIKQPEFSVLAYVPSPCRVILKGWIYTEEGKQESNLFEGRPGHPVYRVMQRDLRPMPELVKILAMRDLEYAGYLTPSDAPALLPA